MDELKYIKRYFRSKTTENIQNIFEKKIINSDNIDKLIYFLGFKIYDDFNNDVINKYRNIYYHELSIKFILSQ